MNGIVGKRPDAMRDRLDALQERADKISYRWENCKVRLSKISEVEDANELTTMERAIFAIETAMESPEATTDVLEQLLTNVGV